MIQANTAGTGNSPCTKQGVSVINGVPTEILYINYGNRDFVLITQVGKMGTVLDIKKYVDGFGEMKQIVNTVFGKRGDENLELYARMSGSHDISKNSETNYSQPCSQGCVSRAS